MRAVVKTKLRNGKILKTLKMKPEPIIKDLEPDTTEKDLDALVNKLASEKDALRTKPAWTPIEDSFLIKAHTRGIKYKFIAKQLGKSAQGCSRRVERLHERGLVK